MDTDQSLPSLPQNVLVLPQNVLVKILEYVDLKARLTSCAFVSSSWAEAAQVATASITFRNQSNQVSLFQSFQQYVDNHGEHITCLRYLPVSPHACSDPDVEAAAVAAAPANCLSRLPCSRLLELNHQHWAGQLQLGPTTVATTSNSSGNVGAAAYSNTSGSSSGWRAGLLHAVTGLTSLTLDVTRPPTQSLLGGAQSLTALTALPRLQSLSIAVAADEFIYEYEDPQPADTMPSTVLQHLQQLTYLCLMGKMGLDSLQPVNCLTKLQQMHIELGFQLPVGAAAAVAAGLEQQLRQQLSLQGGPRRLLQQQQQRVGEEQEQQQELQQLTHLSLRIPGLRISSSAHPWLQGLAELQSLDLAEAYLHPDILRAMTGLQSLQLSGTEVVGQEAGISELCDCVDSFQHLTSLWLTAVPGAAPFAAACAAVRGSTVSSAAGDQASTAGGSKDAGSSGGDAHNGGGVSGCNRDSTTAGSSRDPDSRKKLCRLGLWDLEIPEGGWQRLFPANQVLPELYDLSMRVFFEEFRHQDLVSLARCCPNLEELLLLRVQDGEQPVGFNAMYLRFQPLTVLTRLTSLSISGVQNENLHDNPEVVAITLPPEMFDGAALAKLVSLRSLNIWTPCTVSERGLMAMTALTRLTHLTVDTRMRGGQYQMTGVTYYNKAPESGPPDVWFQLLQCCCGRSDCRDILLQHETDVMQRVEQQGLDPTLVQLACEEARARVRANELRSEFLRMHAAAFPS